MPKPTEKNTIENLKRTDKPVFRSLDFKIKEIDENSRTIIGIASSYAPDRYNDRIVQEGIDMSNFMNNPVLNLNHTYFGEALPVGRVLETWIDNGKTFFRAEFMTREVNERADDVYKMVKAGYLNAFSIGFKPIEYEQNDLGGIDYLKIELLELSIVVVPAHQDALTVMRSFLGEKKEISGVKEETIKNLLKKFDKVSENLEVLKKYRKTIKELRDELGIEVKEDELEQLNAVKEYLLTKKAPDVTPKELDMNEIALKAIDNLLLT